MRKFKIKINGDEFVVKVEELPKTPRMETEPLVEEVKPIERLEETPETPITPEPPSVPVAEKPPSAVGGAVTAPIQGTVVCVNVKCGDNVNTGDVVVVIDAMKMENDISCLMAGTVKEVCVEEGQTVNIGDTLVIIT